LASETNRGDPPPPLFSRPFPPRLLFTLRFSRVAATPRSCLLEDRVRFLRVNKVFRNELDSVPPRCFERRRAFGGIGSKVCFPPWLDFSLVGLFQTLGFNRFLGPRLEGRSKPLVGLIYTFVIPSSSGYGTSTRSFALRMNPISLRFPFSNCQLSGCFPLYPGLRFSLDFYRLGGLSPPSSFVCRLLMSLFSHLHPRSRVIEYLLILKKYLQSSRRLLSSFLPFLRFLHTPSFFY